MTAFSVTGSRSFLYTGLALCGLIGCDGKAEVKKESFSPSPAARPILLDEPVNEALETLNEFPKTIALTQREKELLEYAISRSEDRTQCVGYPFNFNKLDKSESGYRQFISEIEQIPHLKDLKLTYKNYKKLVEDYTCFKGFMVLESAQDSPDKIGQLHFFLNNGNGKPVTYLRVLRQRLDNFNFMPDFAKDDPGKFLFVLSLKAPPVIVDKAESIQALREVNILENYLITSGKIFLTPRNVPSAKSRFPLAGP